MKLKRLPDSELDIQKPAIDNLLLTIVGAGYTQQDVRLVNASLSAQLKSDQKQVDELEHLMTNMLSDKDIAIANCKSLLDMWKNKCDKMVGEIFKEIAGHRWQGDKAVGFNPECGYLLSEDDLQAFKQKYGVK